MFKMYCAFLSLVKFDAMLSVIVLLMMNFLTVAIDSVTLPVGIAVLVVTCVWCVCCWSCAHPQPRHPRMLRVNFV